MKFRFVENCDISRFPYKKFERLDWSPDPTLVTGTMDCLGYLALKKDIAENGIKHPFIIDHFHEYQQDGAPAQMDVFAIRTGNNRAVVVEQLGLDSHYPALFVAPDNVDFPLEGVNIPSARLGNFLRKWWGSDTTWKDCGAVETVMLTIPQEEAEA